ncbi:MAG: hypothetical protein FJ303_09625 [Planctomycetes bacterium]|nr:hypothetical protein [Planctomycetota bacterium]
MTKTSSVSAADVEGPWEECGWNSGLIERCRPNWNVPIGELSNEMLATFLRQDIATECVLEEATARMEVGFDDDSEMSDGELANNVEESRERLARRR